MQMTPPPPSPPPVVAHWGRHARPLAKLHRGDVWCECVASGWRLRERDGEQEVQFEALSDTKTQHNKSYWNPGRHPLEINILSAHFNLSGLSFVLLWAWRMIPWRQISGPDVHKVHADAPKPIPPARHVWGVWGFTADRQWAREANAVNTQFKPINQTQSARHYRKEKDGRRAAEAEACACKCSFWTALRAALWVSLQPASAAFSWLILILTQLSPNQSAGSHGNHFAYW